MHSRIGQRVAEARQQQFIGRETECRLLRSALLSPELPFCLLYLHGPGGVGKTSLLQSYSALCDELKITHCRLDARNIEPSPPAFLDALHAALKLAPSDDPVEFLSMLSDRRVLVLDTFEMLGEMKAWFQEVLLPQVSTHLLLVIAGRQPPTAAFSLDAGWDSVIHGVRLQNFSPRESADFLYQRAIPSEKHADAIAFTHGHPLALSLLSDVYRSLPNATETALPEVGLPTVVDTLLKRFMAETPNGLRKSALEVCAVVRGTNEALLRELLFSSVFEASLENSPALNSTKNLVTTNDEAADLFAWMRTLSFIDSGPFGLFPHDIAREALLADLRWRDPDWYTELHRRARDYYIHQLEQASGEETQKRLLYDGVFLHRDSETVRAAFTWHEDPSIFADRLQNSDIVPIQNMVAKHEGNEAASAALYWLKTQPEATVVFRSRKSNLSDGPVAFFTMLALDQMTDTDCAADPAAQAIDNYIKRAGPLREQEGATCLRFSMARDTYQAASPLQSLLIVHALRHFLTRGQRLAYTFFCCQNPESWQAIFGYAEIPRVADYFSDNQRGGSVFGRDWRRVPLSQWLESIAGKEISVLGGSPAERPSEILPDTGHITLTEPQFAAAIHDALRQMHHPDKLRNSPLLRSHLFTSSLPALHGPPEVASRELQKVLQETIEKLNCPSKQAQRSYLALRHTYLTPAPTQEDAADRLGLPFSTYRRHLSEGISSLTNILWEQELDGK